MVSVTVYAKPGKCYACVKTKRDFDKLGISYQEVLLDDEMAEAYREQGHRSAPVVEADFGGGASTSWSGYCPTMIEQLACSFNQS